MRARILAACILLGSFLATPSAAQVPSTPGATSQAASNTPPQQLLVDRIIAREKEEIETLKGYSPIIETYIQEVRPDKQLGIVPKTDYYFLGQADFRSRLKVHSLLESEQKGTWMWSYEPAGFLQMILVDGQDFDKLHYRFTPAGRNSLGEVPCLVFDIAPVPKTKGARFLGRIWVEDRDLTIVHIQGSYTPAVHFSLKTFEDEYYVHFDSWRTNVKSGLWLPSYVYIQELNRPTRFGNPSFKAQTYLWGYRLTPAVREAELSRLLVESPAVIKEEAQQQDRSPLESLRDWRHQAENNIDDLLEGRGLLAPQGEVENALNIIIRNLEISNNLKELDLHCRVLLTGNLEMFSVGNTIVLSRGLIDVVPDEASMAAMLAHGMADAMLPKPYQDQFGFSDVMRLRTTEILKRLSFLNEKAETAQNSVKAMELLGKSSYASKLDSAGLFLQQLRARSRQLPRLIRPLLGNQVYFNPPLVQAAPALQLDNKNQIAALPLGSRLNIDPWTGALSLRKSKPVSLRSPRDKMPLEVTPMLPYLTRYTETSSTLKISDLFATLHQ